MKRRVMLECAEGMSRFWHDGQEYGGGDYFTQHVSKVVASVVMAGGGVQQVVVAYLHDVVEDTEVTLDEICGIFGLDVAEAVDAITKREGESRNEYLDRCMQNPTAKFVKLHDAWCNLSASLKEGDQRRIRKYKLTMQKLLRGV